VLDAGVVPRRGPGGLTPTLRETARRYLLEADEDVPLPLEVNLWPGTPRRHAGARYRAARAPVMARDPSRPTMPPPPPPHLVTLRCTATEAALIVRVLRATPAGEVAAAHLADVLAEEVVLSERRSPAGMPPVGALWR
jgi:hypothetical protein